jgi:hypothetical protein
VELDPYDWYLAAFRSAYLHVSASVRDLPTGRHRAAFALGAEDGHARVVPRSRWQLLAALERVHV